MEETVSTAATITWAKKCKLQRSVKLPAKHAVACAAVGGALSRAAQVVLLEDCSVEANMCNSSSSSSSYIHSDTHIPCV
jgi:hypothetical protein